MIRQFFCAMCIGLLSQMAQADDGPVHQTSADPTTYGPSSAAGMERRFEAAAAQYAGYDVPRVALSDIAYPLDPAEFKAMDGFGVIWIAAVSHDKGELPLKRVYAVVDGKEVELKLAASRPLVTAGSAEVRKTLGEYRWDGLYYFPVYLGSEAQELRIDFAMNRSGFVMLDLKKDPQELPDYVQLPVTHPKGPTPPADAASTLVAREYPGYFAVSASH